MLGLDDICNQNSDELLQDAKCDYEQDGNGSLKSKFDPRKCGDVNAASVTLMKPASGGDQLLSSA